VGSVHADADATAKPRKHVKRKACGPKCSPDKGRVEQLEARVQALEALLQKSAADQAARDAQNQKAIDEDQQRVTALATDVDHIKVAQVTVKAEACQLPNPRPKTFSVGVEGNFSNVDGGESTLWNTRTVALPANIGLTGPTVRSNSDDVDSLRLSIAYTDEDLNNWSLSYRNVGVSTGYAGAAPGVNLATGSLGLLEAPLAVGSVFSGVLVPDFQTAYAVRSFGLGDLRFRREKTFAESRRDAWSAMWGIRHVDMNDNLFLGLAGGIGLTGTVTNAQVNVFRTNHLKGTGPTVGVRQRHAFGKRFEWQNMAEAGALIGHNDFSMTRTGNPDSSTNAFSNTDLAIAYRQNDVFPTLDLASRLVFHANDQLNLHVGYEVSRIFNATTHDFYLDDQKKDISLEGITVGASFNFN